MFLFTIELSFIFGLANISDFLITAIIYPLIFFTIIAFQSNFLD